MFCQAAHAFPAPKRKPSRPHASVRRPEYALGIAMSATRIAAALLALSVSVAGAATRDDFQYGNADDGSNLPFRYFVPPSYDGAAAYPLILFLHGAGERGSDNEAQLNNNANGAMRLLDDGN